MKTAVQLIGLVLIGVAAQQLHRAACDQRVSLYAFFNSDTLTCAAFYEDTFINGFPIEGFYFPTNNVMFPDCFMYFIARASTGATAPAMVACSCLLFVLQLAGCYLVMRALTPPGRRWPQTAILLGMGALFLAVNARSGLGNHFFRLPIILTYHAGSNVCLFFGLALVAYLLNARDWQRPQRVALGALFLNTMLGMTSDRLLLIQMIVPATGALLVSRSLAGADAGVPMKRIGLVAATMASASLGGTQLLRIFQSPWQDVIHHYPYSFDAAWHSLCLLAKKWKIQLKAGDELHWLATLSIIACAAHVGWLSLRRWRAGSALALSIEQRGLLFFTSYYFAMTATCTAAVCYSGIIYNPPHTVDFAWEGAARYFLPVLFVPLFLSGLWLLPLGGRAGRWLPVLAIAGLFTLVAVRARSSVRGCRGPTTRRSGAFCPPYVKRLDAVAAQYGLEFGLAGYWEAKVASLLSRRHLHVHPVIANPIAVTRMVSFHWLSNAHCYFDSPRGHSGPPRYQFMLVKEVLTHTTPSRADLKARFGAPAAIVPCGIYHIVIYNRPEDNDFQEIASRECYIHRGRYDCNLGETIRFDARSLPSGILGPLPPDERIAVDEGCVEPGLLSGGPLLHIRQAGTYRVKIVTSSSDNEPSPGRWQVVVVNPKYNGSSVIAEGDIVPGEMSEAVAEVPFSNRHRGRAIECNVHYSGAGTLQMQYVEVTRIK